MTPLLASEQNFRGYGLVGGTDIVLPTVETANAVHRTQPVEWVHEPVFRTQGRHPPPGRAHRLQREAPPAAEMSVRQVAGETKERLSPLAKFGDSVPALAQLMAHDSGFLKAQMPNEMRAFLRYLPTEAY